MPVPVVFFNIPVANPLINVPLILTTVKAFEPVASPVWVALVSNPLYNVLTELSPVFVPDKLATAPLANIALVIAPFAMAVAFPVLVTTPVRLAFVVTVKAFPAVAALKA